MFNSHIQKFCINLPAFKRFVQLFIYQKRDSGKNQSKQIMCHLRLEVVREWTIMTNKHTN